MLLRGRITPLREAHSNETATARRAMHIVIDARDFAGRSGPARLGSFDGSFGTFKSLESGIRSSTDCAVIADPRKR